MARLARAVVVASCLLITHGATGETLTRDLAEGLVYFRVSSVPEDLPTETAVQNRPCVLDLRYARAGESGTRALGDWIAVHAAPGKLVLVLANAGTDRQLLEVLGTSRTTRSLLTIGTSTPAFRPDLVVDQSAADEKAAFDALAAGASTTALTTDNPTKERIDEASLARERPSPDDTVDELTPPTDEKPAGNSRPPQIDAALQRAIHVHRGLKALGKKV